MKRLVHFWRSAAMGAVFLLVLAACGGGGGGTTPSAGDAFRVRSSDPADGAQGVSVDADVFVTFTEAIDPSSVNNKSLRVGVIGGAGEIAGNAQLEAGDPRTIRWVGSETMSPSAAHVCEISSGIRSVGGERVSGTLSIGFRTGAGLPIPELPGPDDLETLAGSLNIGRRSHTATLLADGRVLITGGFSQGTAVTDRAETFSGGFFTLVSSPMQEPRAGHTATKLFDGRVLLAGGYYEPSPGFLATTSGAEVFNPGNQTFTPVGAMTEERVDHEATLLPDGRVLITGGSQLNGSFLADLDTAEIFDPQTNTFSPLGETMLHTHATHVALDQGNGKILLYGGSDTDLRPEWYDVATETFSPLSPAAQDGIRFGACGDVFESGAACIAGGDNLGTVIYVNPLTGNVQNTGSGLTVRRWYATATRVAPDRVLVVGGIDYLNNNFMNATCDLVIEGGVAGSHTYETTMRFPTGMVDHTATRLLTGSVLFCGGLNQNGGEPELKAAYLYTP